MKKPPKITDKQYIDALARARMYARVELAEEIIDRICKGKVSDEGGVRERIRVIRVITNLIK